MLSQSNINKLNLNGLYKCKPNVKYRGEIHRDNLYHCCNWTFKIHTASNGKYYMRDTYWSTGDGLLIQITDENFSEFTLIADLADLIKISEHDVEKYRYEDVLRLAVDSGGIRFSKTFILKGTKKDKGVILENIDFEIESCKRRLYSLEREKEEIFNNEEVPDWY